MLTYYLSLTKRERDVRFPLEVGNLVHGAFEVFYKNGGIHGEGSHELAHQFLVDKRAEDLAECIGEHHATIEKAHRTADACLNSYVHWVDESGIDLNLEIIGSEDKIVIPGPIEGTELNGRIDLLARDTRTGDIVVIDLKLVSSIQDKIRMLHLDTQSKTYALLAREKYGKPVRVSFRMVKINQRTAKTKGDQEVEYTIQLNEKQLDVYQQQLGGIMSDVRSVSVRLSNGEHHQSVAYPSPSDTCSWKCNFFAVCPMLDDPLSDGEWLLNDNYRQRTHSRPEVVEDATMEQSQESSETERSQ
jgi:hypothetical protein